MGSWLACAVGFKIGLAVGNSCYRFYYMCLLFGTVQLEIWKKKYDRSKCRMLLCSKEIPWFLWNLMLLLSVPSSKVDDRISFFCIFLNCFWEFAITGINSAKCYKIICLLLKE